jgi:hypothetical protein
MILAGSTIQVDVAPGHGSLHVAIDNEGEVPFTIPAAASSRNTPPRTTMVEKAAAAAWAPTRSA